MIESDPHSFELDPNDPLEPSKKPRLSVFAAIRELDRARRDAAIYKKMESATPIHEESGEVGKFFGYQGVFLQEKPVYITPSGMKFTAEVEN